MNYKTMMICALLAGSMQNAWGMEFGGYLLNTTHADEAFNTEQFRKADKIIEDLDLRESGSDALIAAKKACDAEGINLRETEAPEFERVAREYRASLGTHHSKNPDALALEINSALQAYRANKDANNNKN